MNLIGMTLYEGPSVLDGNPIVAIATLHSNNRKTGDMVQVWILRQDISPSNAVREGEDSSICGSCIHRHHTGGACYVVPFQAPQGVWKRYHEGRYPKMTGKEKRRLKGRAIRFGAYGDPAAVPYEAWKPVVDVAGMVTGYTHQVGHSSFDPRILDFCMISSDAEDSAAAHRAMGYRTFRVRVPGDPKMEDEVVCPAATKADVQCLDCGLCNGANQDGPSVVIDAHGQRSRRFELIAKAA